MPPNGDPTLHYFLDVILQQRMAMVQWATNNARRCRKTARQQIPDEPSGP
jgi:hypothetical protein